MNVLLPQIRRRRWRKVFAAVVVAGAAGYGSSVLTSSSPAPTAAAQSGTSSSRTSYLGADFSAVACADPSFCVASYTSTGTDYVVTYDGHHWSNGKMIEQYDGVVTAIACPKPDRCTLLNDVGEVVTLDGSTWSKPVPTDRLPGAPYPGTIVTLSCPTLGFCVIADGWGRVLTEHGATWSSPITVDGDAPLNAISCSSNNFCVAVDGDGRALVENGTSWSPPRPIDPEALTSVSCASPKFCIAADVLGRTLRFNGNGWSTPMALGTISDNPLALSCRAEGQCLAVLGSGAVERLSGGTWQRINALTPGPYAADCPPQTPSRCVAVGYQGDALVAGNPFGSAH